MIQVPHLEWHVTHSCNFMCDGCGHYTNDGYKQNITLETLREWYLLWNRRIRPRELSLLGGEPFLNKEIVDIIYMTKEFGIYKMIKSMSWYLMDFLFDRTPGVAKAL